MRAGNARAHQQGFTYIALLAMVALLAIALSVVGPAWADRSQREKETELLRIGALYAKAIATYYAASPGSAKQFPSSLDDLLADKRMVGTVRHLRKLYADPMAGDKPWGLMLDATGRIQGIYSQSQAQPLRREAVQIGDISLAAAAHYSDWKFVAAVPR